MTSTHPDLTATRRYARLVRTTLRIHDDVLEAARYIANNEGMGVGDVVSRLARRGLEPRCDAPHLVNRFQDD
jgi:2-iminoacetate synthase ThiH